VPSPMFLLWALVVAVMIRPFQGVLSNQ